MEGWRGRRNKNQGITREMLKSEYPNSGFSFDNVVRNTALLDKGFKLPLTTSTGTTIVGCLFKVF